MTTITLSALEISEFLVGQEMTLYLYSSVLLNLSCFEACEPTRYPREDGTNHCCNDILNSCFYGCCKACFGETFFKLFVEEQTSFWHAILQQIS